MKIFEAKRIEGIVEIKYRVKAADAKEAEAKIFAMCGQHLKVKEL